MHILIFIWSLLSLLLSLILLLSHQFYLVLLLLLTIIMIIINIIILFLSLFLKIIILITHSNRSCTCQFRWQRRRQRATRSSSIICVLEYSKIFNVVSLTQQLDVFFYIYTETSFFFLSLITSWRNERCTFVRHFYVSFEQLRFLLSYFSISFFFSNLTSK